MTAAARSITFDRPRPRQATLSERLDELARRAGARDAAEPARAVFLCVLALLALGFLLQVSHAATTVPRASFDAEVVRITRYRLLGLLVLLLGYRIGPRGIDRFIPALTVLSVLALLAVYLPGLDARVNGSRRWLALPGVPFTIQPSEIARVVVCLWIARRAVQLGPRVESARAGYLPMLALGCVLFALILFEPDVGGALLFLLCFAGTMWVGGARPAHVAGTALAVGAAALAFGVSAFTHVRERIDVWLGASVNDQVSRAAEAMASGDLFGVGLTHGAFRNTNLQYMQTDYVFALVGEELGFFGLAVVVGLFLAFAFHSLRLVSSLRDRFAALVAFGLLVSVAFQAMLHVQVVTGLAPPKGMTLPFLSEGGSSLVASSFAVGLALGAARRPPAGRPLPRGVPGR